MKHRCGKPAKQGAFFGPATGIPLCEDHYSAACAIETFRVEHEGAFQITSSW